MLFFKNLGLHWFWGNFWVIFHNFYIPVGIGKIGCSELPSVTALANTATVNVAPPCRGSPRCPAQDLFIVEFPLRVWPLPEPDLARVVVRATCFVRNRHSKEILTSSTTFKLLLKNRATFAKNPLESRFQVKQVSLPTFTKHDFGVTRGLDLGLGHKVHMLSVEGL
jgi:hypothetical protein